MGTGTPEISVVMAVYNGGYLLQETLDSIGRQQEVDLELVVVDDGSTDSSVSVLQDLASGNDRVRVIRKNHEGLTRALIVGCRAARTAYIARHDAKDISAPERLVRQLAILKQRPDVSVVSSWVDYRGPCRERLGRLEGGEGIMPRPDLESGLAGSRLPHHGSTMFRKSDYEAAGGYRPEFYFAQDLDLWLRLFEMGEHYLIPRPLYTAHIDEHSISGRYREEQDILARIIVSAALSRKSGLSDEKQLLEAVGLRRGETGVRRRRNISRSLYFLGCLLAQQGNRRARHYLLRSIKFNPLQLKPWGRIAYTYFHHRREL